MTMTQTPTLPVAIRVEPDALPAWALELARQAVLLQANRKTCMLILRVDGLAWQIFDARPALRANIS